MPMDMLDMHLIPRRTHCSCGGPRITRMLRCEFSSSRAAAGRSSGRRAYVSLVVAAAVHVLLALATSVAAAESEDVVNFQLLADATLTLTLAGRLAQTQGRVFVHARARRRGGGE